MSKSNINIGLDSQCFTYLISALEHCTEPKINDKTREEKIALVRLFLYADSIAFWLCPTVIDEYNDIRDQKKLDQHISWEETLFCRFNPEPPESEVIKLKTSLLKKHNKKNDCKIVSEYKLFDNGAITPVLSYDKDLRSRLNGVEELTPLEIMSPSCFWKRLDIKKGNPPITSPHLSNPLSDQSWWRW